MNTKQNDIKHELKNLFRSQGLDTFFFSGAERSDMYGLCMLMLNDIAKFTNKNVIELMEAYVTVVNHARDSIGEKTKGLARSGRGITITYSEIDKTLQKKIDKATK